MTLQFRPSGHRRPKGTETHYHGAMFSPRFARITESQRVDGCRFFLKRRCAPKCNGLRRNSTMGSPSLLFCRSSTSFHHSVPPGQRSTALLTSHGHVPIQ